MASSGHRTSFSSLPPELRLKIYRYVVPSEVDIHPKLRVRRRKQTDFPGRLLRINKLFNSEAAAMLYSANRFSFDNFYDGVVFLRRIGKVNQTYIKNLTLGTFWFTHAEASILRVMYDDAQERLVDWIATVCTNLSCLSIGELAPCSGKWYLKTLKKIEYLIKHLKHLDNVVYSKQNECLVMSAEPMNEEVKTRCGYETFDIDGVIGGIKAKAAAVRSAAAKKAAVTRKANKRKAEAAKIVDGILKAGQTGI